MNRKKIKPFKLTFALTALFFAVNLSAQTISFAEYHAPKASVKALKNLSDENGSISKIIEIAESPKENKVVMIEIGPEVNEKQKSLPAILVAANMDGTVPISTEAALYLAQMILEKPEARENMTWYILPVGNPDAAERYFSSPLYKDARNGKAFNDDKDDQTDEDGFDDLNKDGFITQMRVKDPSGRWIPVNENSPLMKRADAAKGEKGIYKLYSEGIDNDNDGKYNEDGKGGVNVNANFPQLFKSFTTTGGVWPGSEKESYNLMRFVSEHPEIAMTIAFGSTNWCMVPPKGGRRGSVDLNKIKIPKRIAKRFNADADKTYTMKEIMNMVQAFIPPGMEVTESMVASFLGLGAVINPLDKDLKYYKELNEKYKEYLKKNKLDAKRFDPASAKNGSFELWSYYQLGVPTFTMDFWTLPKPEKKKDKDDEGLSAEKIGKMSSDEFVALGEEKIAAFLKSAGAPPQYSASMVIGMVESGRITPEKIAEMMKKMSKPKKDEKGGDEKEKALIEFSEKYLDGKGFVKWEKFKHPTLGEVEIGGAVPFVENTPPKFMIDSLLSGQVPWVLELTKKLPKLKILKTETKAKGAGIYEVSVWVENSGYLPFPTAMGERNQNVPPAVLTIEGKDVEFLSGKKRTPVNSLGGLANKEIKFLIKGKAGTKLTAKFESKNAWSDNLRIELGGAK
ncbi:MAG: hypothetical protein GXO87_13105 [Chlorobi bacterium]|nr:hypothetical protein [Chlorobiota bacterium]